MSRRGRGVLDILTGFAGSEDVWMCCRWVCRLHPSLLVFDAVCHDLT